MSGAESFAGAHAIVTGGARGVGRRVAELLAGAGAAVSVLDVLDTEETVATVRAAGGVATGFTVDVRDRAAVRRCVDAAVDAAGRLDVLATLAAVYGSETGIDELTEAEVDHVLGVNLKGTLWTVQAALPHLRGGGRIVCVGSVAGRVGGVLAGPHYAASKGGVHTLVRWLAKAEARHGIRVNGVAPGAVDTEMIAGRGYAPDYCPLGRFADPVEIAAVVRFLASPDASYLTGTVVDANGGYHFS